MKKIAILLTFLVVLMAGALSANADSDNSAVVMNDAFSCGVLVNDGGYIVTPDTHLVDTNSKNDNIKLTCMGQLETQGPESALVLNYEKTGAICFYGMHVTTDWKSVVTPSGKVMLTCHFKTD